MPFVLLLAAVLLIVPAIRGAVGDLGAALRADLPPFAVWIIALGLVASLSLVPGLRGPSRLLMILILLVMILTRYQAIVSGFQTAVQSAQASIPPMTPGASYAVSTDNPALASPNAIASTIPGATQGAAPSGAASSTALHAGLTAYETLLAIAGAG